ncbi:MAG: hypothetical protein MJ238_06825 [Bacilli bacterium]|nr:hypothetical protein [Bacilli bacterium]
MKKCLMLVEGPFDQQRLSLLKDLFDGDKLSIIPCGTDATTHPLYYEEFESMVVRVLKKDKRYDMSMFDEFVHVMDTDGCFIPDSCIVENADFSHIKYREDKIECCSNVKGVVSQHENKRRSIEKMLESGKVKIYYNSTNIDHAFDKNQNPSSKAKRNLALQTYAKYQGKEQEYIRFLNEINASKTTSYKETWEYIKEGFNSLNATSNIICFLVDHIEDLKEDYKELLLELTNNKK